MDLFSAALRNVDLEISSGEFVVLAGPSGSGKSTLLRVACGLVPHFHGGVISGEVSVAGCDLRGSGPAELASEVGLVAQDPETQVVSTNVEAELRLPLELRGVDAARTARAVEETALVLGIQEILHRQTTSLSGGELQRVALAAAMVTRPSLLLLDEATSQLDPVAADGLIWSLRRLNEEFGVTVICCEHRIERCLDGADRALAMREGSVSFDGSPDEFCEWALDQEPALAPSPARALRRLGLPAVASRRRARDLLRSALVESSSAVVSEPEPRGRCTPQPAAIELDRVTSDLGDDETPVRALDSVSLSIRAGERIALLGANGAGKTTLLRVGAGLIDPDHGRVRTGDRGVAMLPQRPSDLLVRDRVGEELPGPEGTEALALVGLSGFEDRDPRDLSGGEKQRLAIALVLAGRSSAQARLPAALLFDEPTRGMDRTRKDELAELLIRISSGGCAVTVATHDLEFAASFADRVILLARGRVIADGPLRTLIAEGTHFSTELSRLSSGRWVLPEDVEVSSHNAIAAANTEAIG